MERRDPVLIHVQATRETDSSALVQACYAIGGVHRIRTWRTTQPIDAFTGVTIVGDVISLRGGRGELVSDQDWRATDGRTARN